MRLSMIVELLLILLLLAFAAYGRVIEHDGGNHGETRAIKQSNVGLSTLSLKQATDNVNRYCTCNENICNCCRDFHIPLVQLKGPGCASLQYLQGDNLAVQLSFGNNILTSTIVNGKSPKPVCVPLPGGFTKFCGRIYSIQRDTDDHFKACLGLELQSSTELEASLRVSCFRFGPDGLNLSPAEPLPITETESSEEDDDDDFFGLGSDDDDDDDEDDEGTSSLANSVANSPTNDDADDAEDDDDDDDVLGFGALLDIITGGDDTTTKKPKVTTAAPLLQFTIPIITRPTTSQPLESYDASTSGNNVVPEAGSGEVSNDYEEPVNEDVANTQSLDVNNEESNVDATTNEVSEEEVTQASNKIAYYTKPSKVSSNKIKATVTNKKKPAITSGTINSIENVIKKKPVNKPVKVVHEDDDDDDDDLLGEDDLDDDDDDDDEILTDDDDDDDEKNDEDEPENHEEDEDEKAEDIEDLDEDDDEEDAMISALVYGDKKKGKKDRVTKNQESYTDDDDSDYGLGLTGLLARRSMRSGRQSKVMRL